MSGPTKVIVVDPDPRAGKQLRLGFSREGVDAVVVEPPADVAALDLPKSGVGVVVVGGTDGVALELVRQARAQLRDVPIVFAGTGVARSALHAAGADEVIEKPAFLRDVVTVTRIMSGVAADERDHIVGSLAETTGVFTLVRALASMGRSAVLTLIRGLRRGEVRFYRGEVTSAQVGLIHGQAALHQLLLWTDARFDFAHEDIVRRQQIPLSSDELFADAERFLDGVRESAGDLSPAMILEQDVTRVHNLGKQIPTEVHGVLRMFDGHRVLADVLEDSPYRVFETLRVAQKAMEAGLLRPVDGQKPKATWKAVLAIEEWLVGKDTREAVVERTKQIESAPVSDGTPKKTKKKKGSGNSKKNRAIKSSAKTPPVGVPAAKNDIDWGALVPRVIGAEVGPLSGVVPAMDTHGEIDAPTRDKPREGLEALMDTDKRTKIFPTDIGLEPSVVVKGGDTDEWERVELEAKARVEAEEKAATATAADKEAAEKAAAEKAAAEKAAAEAEAQRVRDEAQAQVAATVEKMRLDRVAREQAEAKATDDAARVAAADEAKAYAAKVKAAAEAKRLEADKAAADKAAAEQAAIAKAKADRLAAEQAAADKAAAEKAAADKEAAEKAAAKKAAADKEAAEHAAAAKAAWEAADRAEKEAAAAEKAAADKAAAEEKAAADKAAAEEKAAADKAAADKAAAEKAAADKAAADKAAAAMVATPVAPAETASAAMIATPIAPVAPPLARDEIVTKETAPLTVAETPSATTTVFDKLTVVAKADTAHLSATPTVTVTETPTPTAVPKALDISPSDGIVRAVATADTVPAGRGRPPNTPPAHDGPPIKETSGELGGARRSDPTPTSSEPSILVSDLQSAHAAAAAAIEKAKAAPPSVDAASASRELEVAETRKDALAATDAEEAFFNRAERPSQPKIETFEDLDEGYEKPSFWDRVFGRKPKKKL